MSNGDEELAERAEEESSSDTSALPPSPALPSGRADGDWVGPLGKQVGNPDKACLSCIVVIAIAVLVFIACLVFYYLKNPAFHQS